MILEQTVEKLFQMKLRGMVSALEQWKQGGMKDLEAPDLLGLLVDAEWTARENRRLTQRLRAARFPMPATVEAIDYQHPRGLGKQKMLELLSSRWVHAHQNLIITGKTGLGKTYLPCALGNKACRDGYRVLYTRAPKLFGELYQARVVGKLDFSGRRLTPNYRLLGHVITSSTEHRRKVDGVLREWAANLWLHFLSYDLKENNPGKYAEAAPVAA